MSKARDARKRNDRLAFSVLRNPAVAALYPNLAAALAKQPARVERAADLRSVDGLGGVS